MIFKPPFILCIQTSKWHSLGVHSGFQARAIFLQLGIGRDQGKEKSILNVFFSFLASKILQIEFFRRKHLKSHRSNFSVEWPAYDTVKCSLQNGISFLI